MLVGIALASFAYQTLGPVLPPNCSPQFQATILSVEDALHNQDFKAAKDRLRLLPKLSIGFAWSDDKVPSSFRAEYRKARDEAFAMWKSRVPKLSFSPTARCDIKFSFEPELAVRPETSLPAGHVAFFSEDPGQPRLDFVMGLKRGRPAQTSQVTDVFDDVAYAIGAYLGIADGPTPVYTMGPSDLPRMERSGISGTELTTCKRNLVAIDFISKAVEGQVPIVPVKAEIFVDKSTLEAPPALQGDRVDFDIEVSNHGNGALAYSMFPDCGCTVVADPDSVAPQSTRLLRVAVDTRLFSRDMEKHVLLYTNDPATPVKVITLKIPIRSLYRFVAPDGPQVVVRKGGRKVPVYLIPDPKANLDPVSFKFDGMPANVTVVPFHGMLADPESHSGPKMESGYKYVIDIKDSLPTGRVSGTLQVFTTNSDFPNLTFSMYAQKGIIALPEELFMNQVGRVPVTRTFLLSGPGTGFKILGLTTNTPNLTATARKVPDTADYAVDVQYDGKARSGELIADVRIKTSDPVQPIIHVAVRAKVQ
ncbi:MAG: hypothetical protein P4L46_14650 [Fimbriimonas sp.]|nr:hypothetical protein [Fimbriimonas sp.]